MSDNPSLVLRKIKDVAFEDRPVPVVEDPHYVKIAIKATGICGSDYDYYEHGSCGSFVVHDPMVLGHESAGIVVEVGKAVTSVKVGDRVACEPGVPSRFSHEYKTGHYNLDPEMAFAATPPIDGTLARYYMLPEDFCVKLPDNVSLEEGAVVEPLTVGVHSNRQADTRFGDRVIVMGAGPVGLLTAGVSRGFGATEVLVVDIVQKRLDFALEHGYATHAFNSKGKTTDDLIAYIKKAWDGKLPSVGIDCTGVPSCIYDAVTSLDKNGRYVQVGNGGATLDGFPIAKVSECELTVKGSFRYTVGDYQTSVDLIANGKLDVKPLITHRFAFEQAIDAYKFFGEGKAIKIMIAGPK
ncbi:DEKNAAC100158 [Brettanomyces naardenensis]|uniref:DEKNAAC100158 n=1 Tax=Brettanomyces naardenensis TaxID=13370 RepID=A0A448YER7_BRENA|nr:DEKNAAC100158 [Brettanomyces naardenensis]